MSEKEIINEKNRINLKPKNIENDENIHIFSYLTFAWIHSLIAKGAKGLIQKPEDVFNLPIAAKPHMVRTVVKKHQSNLLKQSDKCGQKHLKNQSKRTKYDHSKISLTKLLVKCFGVEFLWIGILKFLEDLFTFSTPVLLSFLIRFLKTGHGSWGLIYAGGMLLTEITGMFTKDNL